MNAEPAGPRRTVVELRHEPRTAGRVHRALTTCALLAGLMAAATCARAANVQRDLVEKGRAEADILWRRGFTLGDTLLDGLLQRTLDTLTVGVPRPEGVALRVHVFRSPELNAFALPDGSIFVFAGLLSTLTDFDQVSFVLGHEAQHALGQHALKQMESANSTIALIEAASFITSLALATSGLSNAGLIDQFAQLGLGLSAAAAINGYGRALERDADLAAVQFLASAGRAPCGGIEAMQALQLHEEHEPGRLSNVFWGNHPLLTDRVRYLREASHAGECTFDSAHVADDYAPHKWPMSKLSASLWVTQHESGKALRLANDYGRLFPEDAGMLTTIGDALAESARPETLALAVTAYEHARILAPDDRAPLRGLALVAEKRGDSTACVRYLERYLEGDAPVRDRRQFRRKLEAFRARFGAPALIDSTGAGAAAADSTASSRSPDPRKED